MEYSLKKFQSETDVENYVENYVNIEEFLECCRQCPEYGKIWSCPPFDFDPLDMWRKFSRILIYGYRIEYSGERSREEMTDVLLQVKERVTEELFEMEKQIPGSVSLSAGDCEICETCSRVDGQPCRFPERMRYSIESLGGNVGKTISRLCGIEIEWIEEGRLPEHFVLCGGLLIK